MTNLVSVEIRRLLGRRLFRMLAILALVIIAAASVATFVQSERLTQPEILERTRAGRAQAIDECVRGYGESFREFPEDGPPKVAPSPPSPDETRFVCERDNAVEYFVEDKRFHMTSFRGVTENIGFNLILVALVIGASFVGAEWVNRTIAMQLTWEPRRSRVFAAKILACALVVFAGVFLVEAITGLALLPAALVRGTMEGTDAVWLRGVIGSIARVGTVAAIASAITASVAIIARNSAGALAVSFGYLAILERVVAGLRPKWQPWLLGDNAAIFVTGNPADFAPGRSTIEALVVIGVYAAVVLAVSAVTFRRTDIA